MADATGLGPVVRKGVGVQVPPSARAVPPVLQETPWPPRPTSCRRCAIAIATQPSPGSSTCSDAPSGFVNRDPKGVVGHGETELRHRDADGRVPPPTGCGDIPEMDLGHASIYLINDDEAPANRTVGRPQSGGRTGGAALHPAAVRRRERHGARPRGPLLDRGLLPAQRLNQQRQQGTHRLTAVADRVLLLCAHLRGRHLVAVRLNDRVVAEAVGARGARAAGGRQTAPSTTRSTRPGTTSAAAQAKCAPRGARRGRRRAGRAAASRLAVVAVAAGPARAESTPGIPFSASTQSPESSATAGSPVSRRDRARLEQRVLGEGRPGLGDVGPSRAGVQADELEARPAGRGSGRARRPCARCGWRGPAAASRAQRPAACRSGQLGAAGDGEVEQRVELRPVERRALGGALHLDERARPRSRRRSCRSRRDVLVVGEVETGLAVDDADADTAATESVQRLRAVRTMPLASQPTRWRRPARRRRR